MYISDREIERIVFKSLGYLVNSITRFNSGDCHYVYDVKTDKKDIVIRFSSEDNFDYLKGAKYWLNVLKQADIKVPEVLYINSNLKDYKYYFMIIERFSGCDIGYVYPDLSTNQKRDIACDLVSIQNKVAKVSTSKYPGKKFLPTDKLKAQNWYDYITDISDIAYKIEDKSLFDFGKIYEFERRALKYKDTLNNVTINAYLDDIAMKNVIVDRGNFTGVVDIDYLSYGDNLMAVAYMKMWILKNGYDLDYIDFWTYEMNITPEQSKLLDLYTLRYCLEFMSEVGDSYLMNNKLDYKPLIDRLNLLYDDLKRKI